MIHNVRQSLDRLADWQGILAFLSVAGAFSLGFANLFLTGNATIPDWAIALVLAVAGFYFGGRATANGAKIERQSFLEHRNEAATAKRDEQP